MSLDYLFYNCGFPVSDIKDITKVKKVKNGFLYYFDLGDFINVKRDSFTDKYGVLDRVYNGSYNLLARKIFELKHRLRMGSWLSKPFLDLLERYGCDKDDFLKFCENESSDSEHDGFYNLFNNEYRKDCDRVRDECKTAFDNLKVKLSVNYDYEITRLFKFFECVDGETCPVMLLYFDKHMVYFPSFGLHGRKGRKEYSLDLIGPYLDIQHPNEYVNYCLEAERINNDYWISL